MIDLAVEVISLIKTLISGLPQEIKTLILIALSFIGYEIAKKYGVVRFKKNAKTHNDCPLYPDMLSIVNKTAVDSVNKSRQISKLYYEIQVEQDNYLDIVHEEILLKMIDDIRILKPSAKELKDYRHMIHNLEQRLKKTIVKWFRENHYAEKSPELFEIYIVEKTNLIIGRVADFLNEEIVDFSFTREQLLEQHQKSLIPYAKEEYRKAFLRAREITIEKENKIEEVEKAS